MIVVCGVRLEFGQTPRRHARRVSHLLCVPGQVAWLVGGSVRLYGNSGERMSFRIPVHVVQCYDFFVYCIHRSSEFTLFRIASSAIRKSFFELVLSFRSTPPSSAPPSTSRPPGRRAPSPVCISFPTASHSPPCPPPHTPQLPSSPSFLPLRFQRTCTVTPFLCASPITRGITPAYSHSPPNRGAD